MTYAAAYLLTRATSLRVYEKSRIQDFVKNSGLVLCRLYEDEILDPPARSIESRRHRQLFTRCGMIDLISDAFTASWPYVVLISSHPELSFDPITQLKILGKDVIII